MQKEQVKTTNFQLLSNISLEMQLGIVIEGCVQEFDGDEDQQQLAGILLLTVWHFTQISSVSLQPSLQRGQHQKLPVKKNRHKHQAMATQPMVFLGIWPVSLPQVGQGDPESLPPPPTVIIMGPAAGAGGGGQQAGGGAPYIQDYKINNESQQNPSHLCNQFQFYCYKMQLKHNLCSLLPACRFSQHQLQIGGKQYLRKVVLIFTGKTLWMMFWITTTALWVRILDDHSASFDCRVRQDGVLEHFGRWDLTIRGQSINVFPEFIKDPLNKVFNQKEP